MADPLSALLTAGLRVLDLRPGRPARSRAPAGPAIKTWKGSWIAGDETEPATHGLTHAGAVEGRLQLHQRAVSFVAGRAEDLMREEPTVLTIGAGELRDVRAVPRGAGADGRPTEGSGPRSIFARLVLDTDDGSHLFEVLRARRTARRISEALGVGAVT